MRFVIIALLAFIVFSLLQGAYFLLSDQSKSDRTVRALSRRIGASIALIVLIMLAAQLGFIKPHGFGG